MNSAISRNRRFGVRFVDFLFDSLNKLYSPFFSARMGLKVFRLYIKFVRFAEYEDDVVFDNPLDRIANFYGTFRSRIEEFHTPLARFLALDESVIRFMGNCGFLVRMPGKSDQKGIRIYPVVDSGGYIRTYYIDTLVKIREVSFEHSDI